MRTTLLIRDALGMPIARGDIPTEWLPAEYGKSCVVRCEPVHGNDPMGVRFLTVELRTDVNRVNLALPLCTS